MLLLCEAANEMTPSAIAIAGKNYFVADVERLLRGYHGVEAVLALAHLPDHDSGRQSIALLVETKSMLTTGMREADKRGEPASMTPPSLY